MHHKAVSASAVPLLSGFQLGSANEKHQKEIREWEEGWQEVTFPTTSLLLQPGHSSSWLRLSRALMSRSLPLLCQAQVCF